jgi:hypothetical protein
MVAAAITAAKSPCPLSATDLRESSVRFWGGTYGPRNSGNGQPSCMRYTNSKKIILSADHHRVAVL